MQRTQNGSAPTLHQPLHSKVSNYLNDQRRTGQYCDLILELESGDNAVFGHFCIMGAQSKFIGGSHFMQKSLQFSMHNPLKVTIRNFSCGPCLQTMVDFFYEDVVSIAKEHETHFRQLAKMLAVEELLNLFNEVPKDAATTTTDVHLDGEGEGAGCIASTAAADARDAAMIDHENEAMAVHVPAVAECEGVVGVDEKQNDINLRIENIFDDQRNYFKLNNPRAGSSSNKINYCIGCDFKCYRVQEMIIHMSSCEPSHLTCSLCEIGFLGWREYDAHLRLHSNDMKKPFFCLECNLRFVTRAALLVHHPKHSVETPHRCPHCGKGFKWKQGLSSHLLVHNKEKQMLCDVCGYSTTHMKALKSHKLQHTGEFFKCTFAGCKHTTNRKENLKLHIETHKQERPFVCEVCGCKFSQSKNLKRHALKHSTAEEQLRKYKCQLCSFCSHRSDKLKEHTRSVHTEKAVQLELPEIVENAFENNAEDEFDLPIIPMMLPSSTDSAGGAAQDYNAKLTTTAKRVRKKCAAKAVVERRIRPLTAKRAT